jgi:hypothetical protein
MKIFFKSFLLSIFFISITYTIVDLFLSKSTKFIPLLTVQDNLLGDFYPNQIGIYSTIAGNPPINYHVKINKDGFRENSIKVNCDKKILLLGDSQVFGWGLDTQNTASSLLQKKLIENGFCYEVMNFGQHFVTIGDMYTKTKEKLYKIKNVEYVFVHFYSGNDLAELLHFMGISRYNFKAKSDQDLKLKLMTDRVFVTIREKFSILSLGYDTDSEIAFQNQTCFKVPADVQIFNAVCRKDAELYKTTDLNILQNKLDEKFYYLWDIYIDGVKKIKKILNVDNNKFYFFHIPNHINYKEEVFNVTENDLNYIDFSKDFKKFEKNTDFTFQGDWHLNEKAAKIIADKYFELIRDSLVK